jgi:hypothetical protein
VAGTGGGPGSTHSLIVAVRVRRCRCVVGLSLSTVFVVRAVVVNASHCEKMGGGDVYVFVVFVAVVATW